MVSSKVSTKELISGLSKNTIYFAMFSSIGLLLSLYSLYVEIRHESNPSFDAFCDINSYISCSKAFLSNYGRGFGLLPKPLDLPNPVFGLMFYFIQLIIANISNTNIFLTKLQILLTIVSNIGSIYLGFVLAFVLKTVCVVCVSIYVVNFVLFLIAFNRYKLITSYKRYKRD